MPTDPATRRRLLHDASLGLDPELPGSADDPLARRWRWLLALTAMLMVSLLFYLGAQPFAVGLFPAPWDKLAHFLLFATLAALLWLATGGRRPLLLIGGLAVIGLIDEGHQARLPGRSMELADLLTDVAAASLTVFALQLGQGRTG